MKRLLPLLVFLFVSTVFAGENSEALIAALKKATTSSSPHVRAAAARALGDMDAASARDQLIALLHDPDEVVSAAAAETLAKFPDHSTSTALIDLLARNPIPSTNDTLIVKDSSSQLQQLADMKAEERSEIAIRTLSRMQDTNAIPVIIDRGLGAPQIGVRISAAIALGRLKSKAAVKPLLEILDLYYRSAHTDTGPTFGTDTKLASQKLKESNAYLRSAVVWALGAIADPIAKPTLTRALEDDNSIVRDTAKEALEKL